MSNLTRGALLVAIAVGATAWSGAASANDPAAATALFNEAKGLIKSGRFAEACPKFEESQRLDPGIGTQFNLADCYERAGRTATAWATFLDVASSAKASGQDARESVARSRAATLEAKLSKLSVVVATAVAGMEVRRNGELLGATLWGTSTPVDPGDYTIEASAPGKKTWSSVASVAPSGAVTVTIPELEAGDVPAGAPAAAVAAGSAPTPGSDGSLPSSTPDTTPRSSNKQRTIGLVVGGAGVVGLGLGAVFGLQSMSKHSSYMSHCTNNVCDPAAVPLHDEAVKAGNLSTITFIAGGALVAVGGVLWLTSPSSAPTTGLRVSPLVGSSTGGLTFAGGW
jgi:hypothetical protein